MVVFLVVSLERHPKKQIASKGRQKEGHEGQPSSCFDIKMQRSCALLQGFAFGPAPSPQC